MNREIKFRAWDTTNKKMVKVRQILIPDGNNEHGLQEISVSGLKFGTNPSHWLIAPPLMQYTGLRDKSDNEIFEGDIVRWDNGIAKDEYRGSIWQIIWDNNYAQFTLKLIKGLFTDTPYFKYHWKHYLEVIGNIYENPELLQEAK